MRTSNPPPITSSRWGARTKRIVVLITLLFIGIFLWNLADILPLVIVATILSYLLWPLVNLIERTLSVVLPFPTRSLAVILTFVVVIAMIAVVVVMVAPILIAQTTEIGNSIPRFIDAAEVELNNILSRPISIAGTPILIDGEPVIPLDRIQEVTGGEPTDEIHLGDFDIIQVLGPFLGSVGGLTGPAFSVLGGALNAIINMAFLIVIMFYFMRDGDHFTQHLVDITPGSYRGDVRRLLYELGRVWNAYLRGQLILSLVVGTAVYISALALGLPNAPILGLVAGLLEFIPNLGPSLSLVPAVMIALVSESSTIPFLSGIPFALVVMLVYIGIQNVEAFFIVPRVMGGSLDLHPVVIILAVISGASIAGALGVILAAPFTATGRLIGQYLYGKLFDMDPFPTTRRASARPGILMRLYLALSQTNPARVFRGRGEAPVIHKPEEEAAS